MPLSFLVRQQGILALESTEIREVEEVNVYISMTSRDHLTQKLLHDLFSSLFTPEEKKRCCQPHLGRYSTFLLIRCSFAQFFYFIITQCSWLLSFTSIPTLPPELDQIILTCRKSQLTSVFSKEIFSFIAGKWKDWPQGWDWAPRLRRNNCPLQNNLFIPAVVFTETQYLWIPENLRLSEFWAYPARKVIVGKENWKWCCWVTGEKSIPCNSTANQEVLFQQWRCRDHIYGPCTSKP